MKAIFILLGLSLLAQAQQSPESSPARSSKQVPMAQLSIIAVAPEPPRRYRAMTREELNQAGELAREAHDGPEVLGPDDFKDMQGLPVPVPPEVGTVPPNRLEFVFGKEMTPDGKERPKLHFVPVGFNNTGSCVKVPAGMPLQLVADQEGDRSQYLTVGPLAPFSQTCIILVPSTKKGKIWSKPPRMIVLPMDAEKLPPNTVCGLNLSKRKVQLQVADQKELLSRGKVKQMSLDTTKRLNRIVAIGEGLKNGHLVNTGMRSDRDSRCIYVFCDTDPKRNGSVPIKAFKIYPPQVDPIPQPE